MRLAMFLLQAFVALNIAQACSCGSPRPPLKALANYDAVFAGEVIDIKPTSYDVPEIGTFDEFTATVKVNRCWKGDVAGVVEVHTGTGDGDCGIELAEEAYLLYAVKDKAGKLHVDACSRTAPLKTTGEETLELDGKLPVLTTPEHEPTLKLEGKINDAGYNGYVFTLNNSLHQRIFYIDRKYIGQWIQVQRGGKWVNYAPNYFVPPPQFSSASAPKMLAEWRRGYAEASNEQCAVFLDRVKRTDIFVGTVPKGVTWRVGFQYLSEQELAAGRKIQQSTHYVWSFPISPSAAAKQLLFKEAFSNAYVIPAPLGTTSSSTTAPSPVSGEAKP